MMTSVDAFSAALAAWGVAFISLGVRRDGRSAVWLAAVTAADLSQLSTAGTERICLLHYPWLVIADWNSCMPSSQLTLASKPRSVAARSGLAKTCRMSPRR